MGYRAKDRIAAESRLSALQEIVEATEEFTFLKKTARTSSGETKAKDVSKYRELIITLDSDAGTGTSPTLDVVVQYSHDGTNWYDLPNGTFTQVTNAAASKQTKQLDKFGNRMRIAYTIGGTSPSFNFGVFATFKR